jgi:hypothetical protein
MLNRSIVIFQGKLKIYFEKKRKYLKKYRERKKILHQSDTATKICQKIWKNIKRSGKISKDLSERKNIVNKIWKGGTFFAKPL